MTRKQLRALYPDIISEDADPALERLVSDLDAATDGIPEPPTDLDRKIRRALSEQVAGQRCQPIPPRRISGVSIDPRWPLVGLSTAAVVLLALLAVAVWAGRPQPVSAQQILQRARAVANNPASGANSFIIERHLQAFGDNVGWSYGRNGGVTETEYTLWYQAPNRWRTEFRALAPTPMVEAEVTASDGESVWSYLPEKRSVTIDPIAVGADFPRQMVPFGSRAGNLAAILDDASQCYNPRRLPDQVVAGRTTYVIDMGSCKPELEGAVTLWLDQRTFFELKSENRTAKGELLQRDEVVSIQYSVPIAPDLFAFAPPAGATVLDRRPALAPNAEEYLNQLRALTKQNPEAFRFFVPGTIPAGLSPRAPRMDQQFHLQLAYVPPDQVLQPTPPELQGLAISERKATPTDLAGPQAGEQPVTVGSLTGFLRLDAHGVDGEPLPARLRLMRDGTFIELMTFGLGQDDLLRVAASLAAIQGDEVPPTR